MGACPRQLQAAPQRSSCIQAHQHSRFLVPPSHGTAAWCVYTHVNLQAQAPGSLNREYLGKEGATLRATKTSSASLVRASGKDGERQAQTAISNYGRHHAMAATVPQDKPHVLVVDDTPPLCIRAPLCKATGRSSEIPQLSFELNPTTDF